MAAKLDRRQYGGFRPFKRSGLNSRFVPIGDIEDMSGIRATKDENDGGDTGILEAMKAHYAQTNVHHTPP